MQVDLDLLRSMFDDVSKRHPGLMLVLIPHSHDMVADLQRSIPAKDKWSRPFPILLSSTEKYKCPEYFPRWNYWDSANSPWDKSIWAMWLYRDSTYSEVENKKCLLEYSTVLSLASTVVSDIASRLDVPSWLAGIRDSGECELGETYFGSARWLMLLWLKGRLKEVRGYASSTVWKLRDIGLASVLLLDFLKKHSDSLKTAERPEDLSVATTSNPASRKQMRCIETMYESLTESQQDDLWVFVDFKKFKPAGKDKTMEFLRSREDLSHHDSNSLHRLVDRVRKLEIFEADKELRKLSAFRRKILERSHADD